MLPVVITFAVLDEGGSVADVGYVLAAQTIPLAVFLLIGGVTGDRIQRRIVMICSDLVRAASQLILAISIIAGRPALWEVMGLVAVIGAGQAFYSPAMTGIIPQIVDRSRLQQANAFRGLAQSTARVLGPALGGFLVAFVSPGWAVAGDAISYLISATCVALIRAPLGNSSRNSSFIGDLRSGWTEFSSRTWVWAITGYSAIGGLLIIAPFMVLGPVIAKDDLGGPGAWGMILASAGAGAFIGGLVAMQVKPALPLVSGLICGLFFVAPLALLAVGAPTIAIMAGAFAGEGGFAVFIVFWDTTFQREIPPDALSRVSAYDWFGSV